VLSNGKGKGRYSLTQAVGDGVSAADLGPFLVPGIVFGKDDCHAIARSATGQQSGNQRETAQNAAESVGDKTYQRYAPNDVSVWQVPSRNAQLYQRRCATTKHLGDRRSTINRIKMARRLPGGLLVIDRPAKVGHAPQATERDVTL
jgi:hypothetical protein